MRGVDLACAFPAVLTAVMITALAGPGTSNAILAIGLFNIPVFARVTRGAALAVRELDYVVAARATGRGEFAIMLRHVLPNISAVLLVQLTIARGFIAPQSFLRMVPLRTRSALRVRTVTPLVRPRPRG